MQDCRWASGTAAAAAATSSWEQLPDSIAWRRSTGDLLQEKQSCRFTFLMQANVGILEFNL